MSDSHLTTAPQGIPPAEQALTALAQAQAIAELLAIPFSGHRFESAFTVLIDLITQATRLLVSINEETP